MRHYKIYQKSLGGGLIFAIDLDRHGWCHVVKIEWYPSTVEELPIFRRIKGLIMANIQKYVPRIEVVETRFEWSNVPCNVRSHDLLSQWISTHSGLETSAEQI